MFQVFDYIDNLDKTRIQRLKGIITEFTNKKFKHNNEMEAGN